MNTDTSATGHAEDGRQAKPLPNSTNGAAGLEAELAEMRDRWIRAEVEVVNVGTRAKRDLADARRYAVQKFATDVVEAAENLRRGLESIPPPSDSEPEVLGRLREGFLGVERAFVALLQRNGIVRSDPTGQAFDPALHQAMSEAPADERGPGIVLRALSAAWTLHGRLLRPAMVVVSRFAAPRTPDTQSSNDPMKGRAP